MPEYGMKWCKNGLKWYKEERFAKLIIAWNYFWKMLRFVDSDHNTFEILNIRVLNMPQIMSSEILGSEYTFAIGN